MARVIRSSWELNIPPHLAGRRYETKPAPEPFSPQRSATLFVPGGAALWKELHTRALAWTAGDDWPWLHGFRVLLPCGECRKHWDAMLLATPPDWGNYFSWTVDRHNEVNARLRKPVLTAEDARKIWSP